MQDTLRILVVDDDEVDRMAICRTLKAVEMHIEISEAEDYETAIKALSKGNIDCAFIDYLLPDRDGLSLVQELRGNGLKIPLIMLTGQGDEQIAVELMKAGASDYLSKGRISSAKLLKTLQNALRVYQAEQEAAIAIQQKLELARQKDDFVSRMTHDLRTPLVATNRMLYLFQQGIYGEISPGMTKAISVIIKNNDNLLSMVSNLLEVYCHEAGEKKLNLTTVDLKEIVADTVQTLIPLAELKGIGLNIEQIEEEKSITEVKGDRLELQRVLTNLVGNAIKFTDEGSIIVRLKGADTESNFVTVEVKDTGMGISPALQARLFERFHKGNQSLSSCGLGLYLSRRIIEAHGGRIELESEVNQGSTFRICLMPS